MLDCLILGDSIAVGTAHFKQECESYSTGGLNTWQWNKKYKDVDLTAKSVIISLGTNDHQYIKTRKELETVRAKVKAEKVYWVLPAIKPEIQEIVKEMAKEYGDIILPIPYLQKDGVHPSWAGYKQIVSQIK